MLHASHACLLACSVEGPCVSRWFALSCHRRRFRARCSTHPSTGVVVVFAAARAEQPKAGCVGRKAAGEEGKGVLGAVLSNVTRQGWVVWVMMQ